MKKKTIYDFTVRGIHGEEIPLSLYQGKILLIINTATHCTYTRTYKELELLYQRYQSQGLEILDFPCNQFKGEAPESDTEIDRMILENYHTTFPRFGKIDVKGEGISPLYDYLTKKKKFTGFDKGDIMTPLLSIYNLKEDPLWETSPSVKWNFTKFLIDGNGMVRKRFEPTTPLEKVEKAIVRLLDQLETGQ